MLALLRDGDARGRAARPETEAKDDRVPDGAPPAAAWLRLDAHLARLYEDGFTIVDDYMSEDQLARFREGLKPYLGSYRGRNPFEGLATERVYTLVGRGKVYEEIASDHRLLAILDGLLAPN